MPPDSSLLIVAAVCGLFLLLLLVVLLLRANRPDPALAAALERLQGQADRQGERMAALPAELRAEVASRTGDVAERLGELLMTQTKVLGEAAVGQNDRLAQQDKLLAERLALIAADMQKAISAQNERLDQTLTGQGEKLQKTLTEQTAATQLTASAIQERLAVIDAARSNIEALGAQVTSLTGILGNKQERGSFGEDQLERIIADRLPPDGYTFQSTLTNGRKPDCLIHLPFPPGPICVDSKFPLEGWIAIRDAVDDAAQKAAVRRFAADVQTHIRKIAESYVLAGETADGALLFVPSESIYAELHTSHSALVTDAARRGVYIVSPTTLWAVLGTMRALMRDIRMRSEAQKIQTEVRHLLDDVGRLDKRVDSLRRHFGQAEGDIDDIEKSTRAIKRRAERVEAVELNEPTSAPLDPMSLIKTGEPPQ